MKIALVTGAHQGLGLEWCQQLAAKGYRVLLTARTLDKAAQAASNLQAQGLEVYPLALDVTNETQLADLAAWVGKQWGRLDLVINNAGINPKDYADSTRKAKTFTLDQLDAHEVLEVIHTNSLAPLLVVKHCRALLRKSDKPLVVNISSWLGSVTNLSFGGHYAYVGSKNLLNVLNKSMAYEIQKDQIISININPGWVQTQMGGAHATLTTAQSVKSMIEEVLDKVSLTDSGKFFNYDGREHLW